MLIRLISVATDVALIAKDAQCHIINIHHFCLKLEYTDIEPLSLFRISPDCNWVMHLKSRHVIY